jgi:hypothetical protein
VKWRKSFIETREITRIKLKLLGSLFMPTSKHREMIPVYKQCNILDIQTSRFYQDWRSHIWFGNPPTALHSAIIYSSHPQFEYSWQMKFLSDYLPYCSSRYQEHIKVTQHDWWYRRNGFLFDESDQAGWLSVHTCDMYLGGACLKFCPKHTCPDISNISSIL